MFLDLQPSIIFLLIIESLTTVGVWRRPSLLYPSCCSLRMQQDRRKYVQKENRIVWVLSSITNGEVWQDLNTLVYPA